MKVIKFNEWDPLIFCEGTMEENVILALKTVDEIYHFLYLLDKETGYRTTRRNHLITRQTLLSKVMNL